MELNTLTAISPIDGRYRKQVEILSAYFSEFALMQYRLRVETEYFIALAQQKIFSLSTAEANKLRKIYADFNFNTANEIKQLEKITNHDVKALEYYMKKELEALNLGHLREFVHFGLTSQDVNNTAVPLMWKEALENEYLPSINNLIIRLRGFAQSWKKVSMLAKTHGQPASPTNLGKEMMVFVERLEDQVSLLTHVPYSCKFGGATGNLNAHLVAYPKINWVKFANKFCSDKLGLQRQQYTTQIEHYDHLGAQFDGIKRINTILLDLCKDFWAYISMEYFRQKTKKGEVGSSAMPHKVNPIDFENAEGNLGIANALFEHLSAKLPVSRLQRDLTDSTVIRNIGIPLAHTTISLNSINKGLDKLLLNQDAINADLDKNWAVVAEAIQTILRRENYPQPYEALKELTRGKSTIDKKSIHTFINKLKVKPSVKKELLRITPFNYTGIGL
ncbi:MAG: adenylosuccinate lyase [bacterium]|jgi:adenylosuccinate lyase